MQELYVFALGWFVDGSVVATELALLQKVRVLMEHLGKHLIIECWGCNDGINDADLMRTAMIEAVHAAHATLLDINVHTFSPHGVTGVAVLSESHLSVHSWPEYGYLAADVFTCGETTEPLAAVEVLRQYFQPTTVEVQDLARGVAPRSAKRPKRRNWTRLEGELETVSSGAV